MGALHVYSTSDGTIRPYSEEELLKIRDSHPNHLPLMITVNLEPIKDALRVLANAEVDLKWLVDANTRLKSHRYDVHTVTDFIG